MIYRNLKQALQVARSLHDSRMYQLPFYWGVRYRYSGILSAACLGMSFFTFVFHAFVWAIGLFFVLFGYDIPILTPSVYRTAWAGWDWGQARRDCRQAAHGHDCPPQENSRFQRLLEGIACSISSPCVAHRYCSPSMHQVHPTEQHPIVDHPFASSLTKSILSCSCTIVLFIRICSVYYVLLLSGCQL